MNRMINENVSPNVLAILNNEGLISNASYIQNAYRLSKVFNHGDGIFEIVPDITGNAKTITRDIELLWRRYEEAKLTYPVSITGIRDVEKNGVGSRRFCTMFPELATIIDCAIGGRNYLSYMDGKFGTEVKDHYQCVSSYFRFMKYDEGGEHFPHYDSDFEIEYGCSTRYSVVMYFSDCESGEIAFVNDTRENHQNSDWTRQATPDEVTFTITPKVGKIVLFPHSMCHSVLPFTDKNKTRSMVRGDLIFA